MAFFFPFESFDLFSSSLLRFLFAFFFLELGPRACGDVDTYKHTACNNANVSIEVAGSILSATDPVAVVALMKELGVSEKLGTLMEGESLLNDGTAIVLFSVFYNPFKN